MARARETASTGALASEVEQRLMVFAEEMGRIVGSAQNRADGWLESTALRDQLKRVRDGAAELLGDLSGRTAKPGRRRAAAAETPARGRSGGKVDAPGKKHRKPPASVRGAKHSDETVSKVKRGRTIRAPRRG